ncbi:MAG: hypothetical protein DRO12_04645 [Thermoprotei archaeon]|nr:MAG: hypothetical protein DRO12_04645 [Thermoprotei archaeon]
MLNTIKASGVVLYPYAHLSPNLAPPETAISILKMFEKNLKDLGISVSRAPFGWYKEFKLECYGHPLAELSRTIAPRKDLFTIEVMMYKPNVGKLVGIKKDELPQHLLNLAETELSSGKVNNVNRGVAEYFARFGLLYAEKGFVYTKYAQLMLKSFESCISRLLSRVINENALALTLPTATPRCLDPRCAEVSESVDKVRLFAELGIDDTHVEVWRARLNKPLKIPSGHELQEYSLVYFYKKCRGHGECGELLKQVVNAAGDALRKVIGERFLMIFRVYGAEPHTFFQKYEEFLREIARETTLATFIRFNTLIPTLEIALMGVDSVNNPVNLSRIRLSSYNNALLLHGAMLGSFEEFLYSVIDRQLELSREGKTPTLPTWLSPVQVRVIPIKKEFVERAREIHRELAENNIRAEVDDRGVGLGRKMRDAGRLWIPYLVMIGPREASTGSLTVRVRTSGEQLPMNLSELLEKIRSEQC